MSRQDSPCDTFLVVLKIYGDAIRLRSYDETSKMLNTHSLRIFCQGLDSSQSDRSAKDIKVFMLNDSTTVTERSLFQSQQPSGQEVGPTDLVTFMTTPMEISKKVSYAVNLGLSKLCTSMEDLDQDDFRKIGAAYLYLDPQFSTQGTQRLQIIANNNSTPIGQLDIEYLVVKNPKAYGVNVPRPKWLSQVVQLHAGHRGAGSGCRGDLPESLTENTVASFNYAARHGADMCELDVMCTADGVPVVYHNFIIDMEQPRATQIDELTLGELQGLKHMRIHDKNCKHDRKSPILVCQESSKPFPTLEEVLRGVDKSCALNIELKWPQLLPNGKSEASYYREINDFVDRILNCINEHSDERAIVLSTLNANIAIMLRLKQTQYPVQFLTTGDSKRFNDPTTKTIKNAIHFAQAFDMVGINPNAANLTEYLVRYAQDRGLLVYAWGKIESAQAIKELERTGLNGVIYDKIDLIKPQD